MCQLQSQAKHTERALHTNNKVQIVYAHQLVKQSNKIIHHRKTRRCGDVSDFATVEPTMQFFQINLLFQVHSSGVTTLHQTASDTLTQTRLHTAKDDYENCSYWCHLIGKREKDPKLTQSRLLAENLSVNKTMGA